MWRGSRKMTGKTYRLLTEAEYEYAARAGTTTAYPWGDDIKLNGRRWPTAMAAAASGTAKQTAPVGSFKPNEFGLYDMVGNVFEWTRGLLSIQNYNGAPTDGSAWLAANGGDCTNRVLRGGSWNARPQFLRSALRIRFSTDTRDNNLGFRVGRTLVTP